MLGVQINNSSAWPEVLREVGPAMGQLHANTLETPVYLEQFERTGAGGVCSSYEVKKGWRPCRMSAWPPFYLLRRYGPAQHEQSIVTKS